MIALCVVGKCWWDIVMLMPRYDNHGCAYAGFYQQWYSISTDACFLQLRLKFDPNARIWQRRSFLQRWCVDMSIHQLPLMLTGTCPGCSFAMFFVSAVCVPLMMLLPLLSCYCHFFFVCVMTMSLHDIWCWLLDFCYHIVPCSMNINKYTIPRKKSTAKNLWKKFS